MTPEELDICSDENKLVLNPHLNLVRRGWEIGVEECHVWVQVWMLLNEGTGRGRERVGLKGGRGHLNENQEMVFFNFY